MTVAMPVVPMARSPHLCTALAMLILPATAMAQDDACTNFARAEMIFVGRVKAAPFVRRISGDDDIEKARIAMEAAENEFKAFDALKMPPEMGSERKRDLAIRMIKAREAFDHTRAMYPPLMELTLTPISVEVPLRGVTATELFLQGPELDPTRSYLLYAQRALGRIAPDVISLVGRPKEMESADADLRFLNEAIANNPGTVVSGTLRVDNPSEAGRSTPLAGVLLRISLDDQQFETTTRADGTFVFAGVPPGKLTIEPVLPPHLVTPPQSRQTKGGCVAVHFQAKFDGRIRGRVVLNDGTPYRGLVDVVGDDPRQANVANPTATNERGEFLFTALPPGTYHVGVNLVRQPSSSAPFRPTYFPGTTDRSLSTPIVVGLATEHADIEWVVSSRLREGTIEVSFNTDGQPQKEMGVCVTMFDGDLRAAGGTGYERRYAQPVIVKVVEGARYRLMAWARTSSGWSESEIADVIGAPGPRKLNLRVASVAERETGLRCASTPSPDKPFAP